MKKIRRLVYQILMSFDILFGRKNRTIILCYHAINNSNWQFSNSIADFDQQMHYISQNYTFVTTDDIYNHVTKKQLLQADSCCITFDDGYKDILGTIKTCQKYGIKPTVFTLTDPEKANRTELGTDLKFLSNSDIKKLKKIGWSIGGHTKNHDILTKLSGKTLSQSLTRPKNIKYLAYPKGKYNEEVITSVKKAGYVMAFTASDGDVLNTKNLFKIPRILIDGTHSYSEFQSFFHPTVSLIRSYYLTNFSHD